MSKLSTMLSTLFASFKYGYPLSPSYKSMDTVSPNYSYAMAYKGPLEEIEVTEAMIEAGRLLMVDRASTVSGAIHEAYLNIASYNTVADIYRAMEHARRKEIWGK